MAKPALKPVLEYHTHTETHTITPSAMWIVTYQGCPFQWARTKASGEIKYERTLYLQHGSAVRVRDRLRQQFQTDDFDIRMVGDGDKYPYARP